MICCSIADAWLPLACCCCFFVAGLLLLLDLLLMPLADFQPLGRYLAISALSPDYLGAISRESSSCCLQMVATACFLLLAIACRLNALVKNLMIQ